QTCVAPNIRLRFSSCDLAQSPTPPVKRCSGGCRPLGRRPAVDALNAARQLGLAPASAAVPGTQHPTPAGGTINTGGSGRALGDDHQRALHRHVAVEALPSLAEVAAAVE